MKQTVRCRLFTGGEARLRLQVLLLLLLIHHSDVRADDGCGTVSATRRLRLTVAPTPSPEYSTNNLSCWAQTAPTT